MTILDLEPQFWYLLEHDGDLLLTVNCAYSFVSYDFTIRLQQEEIASYQNEGHAFLNRLAAAISDSCPAARSSSSEYKSRNIDAQFCDAISMAVRQMRANL